MSYLSHIATSQEGPETHVTGITDIALLETDSGLRVYSASGRDGGILARNAGLGVIDEEAFHPTVGLGADAQLTVTSLGGRDALLVTGPAQAGISGFWLNEAGEISGRFDMEGPTIEAMTAIEVVEIGGQTYFFSAARGTAGITSWEQNGQGRLEQIEQISVTEEDAGNDIFALEHVNMGGQDFVMAVSADGHGVHNFRVDADGGAQLVDSIDMSEGLGVSMPTELTQVSVGGQTFMLVGAAGTSSITVIAVDAEGNLRPTDQVNDDLDTRFQSLSVLEAIEVDGKAYVVAGGADDGLTVMTLLPNGRLLHLETIADDLATALTNPEGIVLALEGDTIALYTAGQVQDDFGASGVGRFEIDPNAGGTSGTVQQGGAGADQLTGTDGADQILGGGGADQLRGGGGADIIVDGAGTDRMWGGAGADIFVLDGDGQLDTIEDFEIGVDRIDMSQMGRFYAVESLEFSSRGDGAQLSINGETLRIKTADGSRLEEADFHYSDLTDLWHVSTEALSLEDQETARVTRENVLLEAEETEAAEAVAQNANPTATESAAQPATAESAAQPAPTESTANTDTPERAAPSQADQEIAGSAGHDMIQGAEGADRITGGSGSDTIAGGSGADEIQGGAGNDMLIGGTYDVDFDPAAATVFRLYQATLDRAPDQEGHLGWVEILSEGGKALTDVAGGFVNSREFQLEYGDVSNEEFVTLLYNNVLGRAADAGGLQGWTEAMDNGASRAQVVVGFSESNEFKVNTAADSVRLSSEGYSNDWFDDVYRMYQATLDRAPDQEGLEGWTGLLAGGMSVQQAAGGFTGSQEFQNTYGSLDDGGFVELLYQNVLGRAADEGGLQGWTEVLSEGAERGQVVAGFSQSSEFIANTAPELQSWVKEQGVDDVLEGGAGHNVLFGGMWSDSFVFDTADGGQHEVADFETWDVLSFEGFGYETADDVQAHLQQDGDDVVFADQGVEVRLVETDLAMLQNDEIFDV